jgi:hypothetical protein
MLAARLRLLGLRGWLLDAREIDPRAPSGAPLEASSPWHRAEHYAL